MHIPCPSAADPGRNPHRPGRLWTLTTVRAILANPRYTGHQVWNRQRTDHELIDPDNTALGTRDVMRWNTPEDWAISTSPAHPALVSEADFIAAQNIRATRDTAPDRTYLLAGILRCGICGRPMESCWSSHRPSHRCRHGHSSATTPDPNRPRNAYLREDQVLARLPALSIRLTLGPGTTPPAVPEIVARLRADRITLTYNPADQTLTADTPRAERIAIS